MRSFHNSSFDPRTLVLLETAFDEAWLTLKSVGNKTVKLARSVLRLAMEGERNPVQLHDQAATSLALTAHEKIGPPFSGPKFSENNAPPGSDGESVIGKH